jgi:hypothetical protein
VGNPNITLSPIDRLSSNKETSELIDIIDKMDLIGTTEYFTTKPQDTHSQQPTESSPK